MAIAASRAMHAISNGPGMHAGRIGFDRTDRTYAWRRRLTRAMADATGLAEAARVNRGGRLARQGHGMGFTVAGLASRKIHTGETALTLLSMYAHSLLGGYVSMAPFAVDGIQSTSVSPVGTNVTIEAFRRSVWRAFELSNIDLVANVTWVFFLGISHIRPER